VDKLSQKYQKITQALTTLEKAVAVFTLFAKEGKSYNPHMDYEEEYRGLRDSMVQRFEYCVDLFWKYLKKNLEVKHLAPANNTPAEAIRKSYSANIITEHEAETILAMIQDRNMTSHMYMEEIAEILAQKIPDYYKLMYAVAQKTQA
jgi:nucleotidyltransferase substrate binding protein (TIGR01987 family)